MYIATQTTITFQSAMMLGGVISVFIACTLGVVQIGWVLFQKKRSNGSASLPTCQFDPVIMESSRRRARLLETAIESLCHRDETREKLDIARCDLQTQQHSQTIDALNRIEAKL